MIPFDVLMSLLKIFHYEKNTDQEGTIETSHQIEEQVSSAEGWPREEFDSRIIQMLQSIRKDDLGSNTLHKQLSGVINEVSSEFEGLEKITSNSKDDFGSNTPHMPLVVGIQERDYCFVQQQVPNTTVPFELEVNDGDYAFLVSSGSVLRSYAPGRYRVNVLCDVEPRLQINELLELNMILRLVIVSTITNLKLRLWFEGIARHIDVPCTVKDNESFWMFLFKSGQRQLNKKEIEELISKNIEYKLSFLTHLSRREAQVEQIVRDISKSVFFEEYGLQVGTPAVVLEYENTDWNEYADRMARPIDSIDSARAPFLVIYESASYAIRFEYMSPTKKEILGVADFKENKYFYFEGGGRGRIGIHILESEEDKVYISVIPLYGDRIVQRFVLTPGEEQVVYNPMVHDACIFYSIEYCLSNNDNEIQERVNVRNREKEKETASSSQHILF